MISLIIKLVQQICLSCSSLSKQNLPYPWAYIQYNVFDGVQSIAKNPFFDTKILKYFLA